MTTLNELHELEIKNMEQKLHEYQDLINAKKKEFGMSCVDELRPPLPVVTLSTDDRGMVYHIMKKTCDRLNRQMIDAGENKNLNYIAYDYRIREIFQVTLTPKSKSWHYTGQLLCYSDYFLREVIDQVGISALERYFTENISVSLDTRY